MSHFQLGYFSKAKGLKGELVLQFVVRNETDYDDIQLIFIEDKHKQMAPHFIEYTKRQHKGLVCKLQDHNTIESIQLLVGKKVHLLETDLKEDTSYESILEQWIGATILDQEGNTVGTLESIETYPHQIIANISANGKEVLVPINDNTLGSFDDENDTITLNIPDGLLDIYLSEDDDSEEEESL